jgi:hypothetical protein
MRKEKIIDRVIRAYVRNVSTKKVRFTVDQMKDVTAKATMETQEVKDALDAPITEIARSKAFEISGNNALYNMDMQAEQYGTKVEASDSATNFLAPCADELEYAKNATTVTLSHTPAGTGAAGIPFIYTLVDGATDQAFAYDSSAAADKFTFSGTTLTLPTGLSADAGGTILVVYDYTANAEDVVYKIENQGDKFPEMVNVLLEVLFRDVCDDTLKSFGYVEMPRAKFDGNVDIDLSPDGNHPFTIKAYKEYCAKNQKLCTWYIPEGEADAD